MQGNNPLAKAQVELTGARLYQGDCIAVLGGLGDQFDAVVTDPPYSSGGQSKGSRSMSTGAKYLNSGSSKYPDFVGDTKDQRSYFHWSALWMSLSADMLIDGGLDDRLQRLAAIARHDRCNAERGDYLARNRSVGQDWRCQAVQGRLPFTGRIYCLGKQGCADGGSLLAWCIPRFSYGRGETTPGRQAAAVDGRDTSGMWPTDSGPFHGFSNNRSSRPQAR